MGEESRNLDPAVSAAERGERLLQEGNFEAAVIEFRRALSLAPGLEINTEADCRRSVLTRLARATMPGPQYTDDLRLLHQTLRPQMYLEIGVAAGETLRLASPETQVIGVDPAPALNFPCPDHIRIYPLSSNAFFAQIAPTVLPSLPPVALAFIDGMHLFEQTLRDFINIEAYCSPNGVIAIHDTLPVAEVSALRSRSSKYWCGDVWKLVFCLQRYRPDLTIETLPSFPSGLTLVSGLNPKDTRLRQSYDQAVAECLDLPFSLHERRFASIVGNAPN